MNLKDKKHATQQPRPLKAWHDANSTPALGMFTCIMLSCILCLMALIATVQMYYLPAILLLLLALAFLYIAFRLTKPKADNLSAHLTSPLKQSKSTHPQRTSATAFQHTALRPTSTTIAASRVSDSKKSLHWRLTGTQKFKVSWMGWLVFLIATFFLPVLLAIIIEDMWESGSFSFDILWVIFLYLAVYQLMRMSRTPYDKLDYARENQPTKLGVAGIFALIFIVPWITLLVLTLLSLLIFDTFDIGLGLWVVGLIIHSSILLYAAMKHTRIPLDNHHA